MTIKVSNNLKNLAKILKTDLYLVGGYVRNSYLNLPNYDIDITSSLSIEQIFERLDGTIYNVKIRSIKMGTVEIVENACNYVDFLINFMIRII